MALRGLPTRCGATQEGLADALAPNLSTVADHAHEALNPVAAVPPSPNGTRFFNFGGTFRLSLSDEIFLEIFQENAQGQSMRVENDDTWVTVRVIG